MAEPGPILTQVIDQGTSWTPTFELLRASGSAYDLSGAGSDAILRLSKDDGGTVDTKSKGGGDTSFPLGGNGSDGQIIFIYYQADTLALDAGLYIMELVYTDSTATPPEKSLVGRGYLRVNTPRTGAI